MTHCILAFPVVLTLLFTAACDKPESVRDAPRLQSPDPAVRDAPRLPPPESGRVCSLIGCASGFSLKVRVGIRFEQLRASTVTVCHNARCYSSSLATLAEPPGPGSGRSISFPNPSQRDTLHTPLISASVWPAASGGFLFDVSYLPWSDGELQDGDVYDVTLTDAHGRRLVNVHEKVSYQLSQPNGPECGSPCHGVAIDRT